MANQPDVVIAGAGIIGCASARALASAGLGVTVVDPRRPCQEASHAAGGLLTPQYETAGPGPFFELCRRARSMYPDFVTGLLEETGVDSELRREGMLLIAATDEDEAELEAALSWQTEEGLRVRRLTGAELRDMEPLIHPEARWGLHLPDDVQVDNRRVCAALVASLNRLGVDWAMDDAVDSIQVDGSRLSGVRLRSGRRLECGTFVLAAGAWSGRVRGLPRPLPVRPLRGEMVQLTTTGRTPRHTLGSGRGYVVPRLDGRLLAGSTVEDVGFRRGISVAGIRGILESVQELAPSLSSARIADAWAGFRPGTPDDLPILGPDPEVDGLVYATGHFRNGILLAPITAERVAELVTGAGSPQGLEPFAPERFAGHR